VVDALVFSVRAYLVTPNAIESEFVLNQNDVDRRVVDLARRLAKAALAVLTDPPTNVGLVGAQCAGFVDGRDVAGHVRVDPTDGFE
jgi:hypothetical protein